MNEKRKLIKASQKVLQCWGEWQHHAKPRTHTTEESRRARQDAHNALRDSLYVLRLVTKKAALDAD